MKCVRCGTEMKVQSETTFQRRWVCPNPSCHSVADENTSLPVSGFAVSVAASPVTGLAGLLGRDPTTSEHPTGTPSGDDAVSFTGEELREMEAEGLTLAEAIRTIGSRPG